MLGILAAAAFAVAAFAQAPAAAQPQPAPSIQAPPTNAPAPEAPNAVPPAPSTIATATLPHDLSPWGMFLSADIVVKAVMVGLVFASFVTWTVWLAKNWELWRATRRGRAALAVLNEASTLAEANARLGGSSEAVARLLRTAVHEVQVSPHPDPEALKERISWLLERVEAAAGRRIGRGMGLLATIGATAPFVGLFAAIPAVVIYNVFSRSIGAYRALLADGSALVMRLLSRDCERVSAPMQRAAE